MKNAEPMIEEEALADGIYFHMPEEQYHALDRLSATGIKKLIVSALQFYTETFDDSFHRPSSIAMHKGKAYHKRILEGQDEFYKCYVERLNKDNFEGVLDTAADLKDYCSKHDIAVTGTKPVLIQRILDVEPQMKDKILSLMQEAFDKEHAAQIQMTHDEFHEVEKAATILEASDLALNFSGGFPEVSILWTDEYGIKCKSRIDYLRHDKIADLKTFSNSQRKSIHACVSQAIAYEKYHVQAVFYMEGLEAIKSMIESGNYYNDSPENIDFLDSLAINNQEFTFIFQESGQVNNCAARKFVPETSGMSNNYWFATKDIIFDMKHKYMEFMKTHGKENAWYEHQDAEYLDDSDLPMWLFGTE